ncbi:MAG: hypothetical protein VW405_00900 [Rhodospirillaceae bacterium]
MTRRWPKTSPDDKCEATVGLDPKSHQPRLLRCGKPATEIVRTLGDLEAAVCEEHATRMEAAGKCVRGTKETR